MSRPDLRKLLDGRTILSLAADLQPHTENPRTERPLQPSTVYTELCRVRNGKRPSVPIARALAKVYPGWGELDDWLS